MKFGDPNVRELEPDVELAEPAPRAPTSRIVKRGSAACCANHAGGGSGLKKTSRRRSRDLYWTLGLLFQVGGSENPDARDSEIPKLGNFGSQLRPA